MHKIELFALLFAVCLLSAATAKPIDEKEPNDDETILLRQKRVTCDLLSFQAKGFSANHSICAAHCIALRKKGGWCINGVCNCRN